jgi:hypothetical protein
VLAVVLAQAMVLDLNDSAKFTDKLTPAAGARQGHRRGVGQRAHLPPDHRQSGQIRSRAAGVIDEVRRTRRSPPETFLSRTNPHCNRGPEADETDVCVGGEAFPTG